MSGVPMPPVGTLPTNINFTDTAPAAPTGCINVKWQATDPYPDPNVPTIPCRDASAYIDLAALAGAGGAGASRSSVTLTTASLATNAVETGMVALGKGFDLLRIAVSCKCRVILYATAASRAADSRPPDGSGFIPPPTPGTDHGVIADFYLNDAAKLDWLCSPQVSGSNGDVSPTANIYYSVENLSTAQPVGIIFTRRVTEV